MKINSHNYSVCIILLFLIYILAKILSNIHHPLFIYLNIQMPKLNLLSYSYILISQIDNSQILKFIKYLLILINFFYLL